MKNIAQDLRCCSQMKRCLEDKRITIFYDPVFREHYIAVLNWPLKKKEIKSLKDIFDIIHQGINHCPWCGTNLPSSLRGAYFETLENEYKLDVDIFSIKDNPNIPEEFKSDEWWKKRKL